MIQKRTIPFYTFYISTYQKLRRLPIVRKGFMAVVLAVSLSGCVPVSVIDKATLKTFNLTEELRIKNPKRDPIKIAEEVGTEMGFSVTSRRPGSLMLKGGSHVITSMVTGHIKLIYIMFTDYNKLAIGPRGQVEGMDSFKDRYDITVMVSGGLGAGTESEAKRIMDEFKQKLLQKIDAP